MTTDYESPRNWGTFRRVGREYRPNLPSHRSVPGAKKMQTNTKLESSERVATSCALVSKGFTSNAPEIEGIQLFDITTRHFIGDGNRGKDTVCQNRLERVHWMHIIATTLPTRNCEVSVI